MDTALDLLTKNSFDKNGLRVISLPCCRNVSEAYRMSRRDVEILALKNGICPSRYERSIGVFGHAGQAKLLESRAAVAGCGGLGGWIIEILARAGVGEIVMADGDVFDESNLNRQLYSCEENIGAPKADAAARRVRSINSAVSAIPKNVYINEGNCSEIVSGCQVVVDALDGNAARRVLFSCCRAHDIPFVHGAVGGYFGQVGVLYGDSRPHWESEDTPDKGLETDAGCPPFTPSFVASIQAAETLKLLAGSDKTLKNALAFFDLEDLSVQKIRLDTKKLANGAAG
ncbi:MAG: HesA/MoeB/ThiF family protein [Synergistaceae bacterium]|nr:HesA/MoeB/ThiF family protein [Synergistaceae bacterium]